MSEIKNMTGGSVDEPKELKETMGFFKYVFNFDDENKAQILNILQYGILAIIPTIIILKITKNIVPEENEDKGSLEILVESVGQLVLLLMLIWLSNKVISYVPTYSKVAYPEFNIISVLLPWLVVLFTMQTKLGHKINILAERLSNVWEGNISLGENKKEALTVKQPFSVMPQGVSGGMPPGVSGGMSSGMSGGMSSIIGNSGGTTSVSNLPQSAESSPNFNTMYQGPPTALVGAASPGMNSEPMASNEAFGSMFGGTAY
jgi:hypothetical protein